MAHDLNATEWLPYSEDMFQVVGKGKLVFLFVDVALTVVIFLLFGEECHFVIKTYKHKDITVKTIWLVAVYPVFALSSLFAVIVPRASILCDLVSACYLSGCLYQFSSLIVLYFGSQKHLLARLQGSGFNMKAKPCCCWCFCCPVLPPSMKSLVTLRLMIFQTAVLQPIIQFVSVVLWLDGKYNGNELTLNLEKADLYLQIIKLTSTFIAIFGLHVLHQSTALHLKTHNTKPKMAVLCLVLFFFSVQGAVMNIPPRFNRPPDKDGLSSYAQMNQWNHLVLVVEMFLLSLSARLLYRRPLELDAVLEAMPGTVEDIYMPDSVNGRDSSSDSNPYGHKGSSKMTQTDQCTYGDDVPVRPLLTTDNHPQAARAGQAMAGRKESAGRKVTAGHATAGRKETAGQAETSFN